jgi:hypothetical protein
MKKYTIRYDGKIPSLNDIYAGKHWSFRSAKKNKFRDIFSLLLLEAGVKWMDEYRIDLEYNSRLDADNVIMAIKFLNDSLKKKYVKEDDARYFKGFSINVNKRLKTNSYKFTITQLR